MNQAENPLTFQVDVSGYRLDRYLADNLPDVSRSRIQSWIRQALVLVDGQPAKSGTQVGPGMVVTIAIPTPEKDDICPQSIALDVIFEDDDLLIINKPAGMVVHPAFGHREGTLVNALLARYPDLKVGDRERPGIVHRLDRDTSGLLVVARTETALQDLRAQFKSRRVKKTYLALVHGHPPAPEGFIEAPIGRDRQKRQRMAVVPDGRPARTGYVVLDEMPDYCLLAVSLQTGRTHQIRVHLAWLGVPVVGDRVYGRRHRQPGLSRQFLHAWRLSFEHPRKTGTLDFEAPLPVDLSNLLRDLWGMETSQILERSDRSF